MCDPAFHAPSHPQRRLIPASFDLICMPRVRGTPRSWATWASHWVPGSCVSRLTKPQTMWSLEGPLATLSVVCAQPKTHRSQRTARQQLQQQLRNGARWWMAGCVALDYGFTFMLFYVPQVPGLGAYVGRRVVVVVVSG